MYWHFECETCLVLYPQCKFSLISSHHILTSLLVSFSSLRLFLQSNRGQFRVTSVPTLCLLSCRSTGRWGAAFLDDHITAPLESKWGGGGFRFTNIEAHNEVEEMACCWKLSQKTVGDHHLFSSSHSLMHLSSFLPLFFHSLPSHSVISYGCNLSIPSEYFFLFLKLILNWRQNMCLSKIKLEWDLCGFI